MFLDAQGLFSDNQTVTTGSSAGVLSTNVVDLKAASQDIGTGEPVYIHINVDTALADASSNSVTTVALVDDDNAALSSPTTIQTLGTFAAASAAGSRIFARIAPGVITQRYIGLLYTTTNGDLSAGAFTAGIVKDIQAYTSYADGLTIS